MVCFEGTRVLKDSCVLYEKLKTQRLCLHLGEECRSGQCFCIEKNETGYHLNMLRTHST